MNRRFDDAGLSLIEALIAVVILGITFVAILGGMATSITGSAYHRTQASENAILIDAAEAVKKAAYTPCATNPNYAPAAASAPVPTNDWVMWSPAEVIDIDYWNGTTFIEDCSADGNLQLVTLRVTSSNNTGSETLSVVKRFAG
jgi:Tfp pilus assembly protein PilV